MRQPKPPRPRRPRRLPRPSRSFRPSFPAHALDGLPRPPVRTVAAFGGVLALLIVGWLWVRDSSLVAVRQVRVTGASGPDAGRVIAALQEAGRAMTTLHVRDDELRTAVEPFASVASVHADAAFPHTLRIEVREKAPVGVVVADGDQVAVGRDGRILRGVPTDGLPQIAARTAPGGTRVTDRDARRGLAVLAAAPAPLRARVRRTSIGPQGLSVALRNGPSLVFGGSERLRAKWVAAAVVLANPTSAGASYIDIRMPERPAAGGVEPPLDPAEPPASTVP
jgi:cell division protein FtsQ